MRKWHQNNCYFEQDGCWIWKGGQNDNGYGQWQYTFGFRVEYLAHRTMWTLLKSPIPSGMELDHKCFNRLCINPDHLEVVTPGVNKKRRRGHHHPRLIRVRKGRNFHMEFREPRFRGRSFHIEFREPRGPKDFHLEFKRPEKDRCSRGHPLDGRFLDKGGWRKGRTKKRAPHIHRYCRVCEADRKRKMWKLKKSRV